MKQIILAVLVLALVGLAAPALAQNVINPTKIEYQPSPDHTTLTKYQIGYFLPGATDPVQTADLPIVPPVGGVVTQTINAVPLTFGVGYTAKLKSVAGAVSGEWSAASNAFDRAPLPPTAAPVVKK